MHVDLRSDTVTRPTPEMRRAMANAEVGDDGFGDDPTVIRLQERAAGLLGKEAALLLPSGTMGNLCAVLAHTDWGDEVIVEACSHMRVYERGGWSMLGGRVSRQITGERGVLDPTDVEAAITTDGDIHKAQTGLVCMENTHMLAGGVPISVDRIEAVAQVAHRHDIPVHLDGARLFNAAIALELPARDLVRPVDSVQICLSKGLGCPIGSLLLGSRDFVARAHRMRQPLGGTMRQAGIIAAAGLIALDTEIDRLALDPTRARASARHRNRPHRPGAGRRSLDSTNQSGIRLHRRRPAGDRLVPADPGRLAEAGIHALALDPSIVRMVTHRDISREAIDYTLQIIEQVLA